MEAFVYLEMLFGFVLLLVGFAAISQWAERKFPRLRRFLDRHMPEQDDLWR